MDVWFEFAVRSEIGITGGRFEPLSFPRGDLAFIVEPPKPKADFYTWVGLLGEGAPSATLNSTWSQYLRMTRISVAILGGVQVEKPKIFRTYYPYVTVVLNELLAWVRVLTRQYWVGYKDSEAPSYHAVVATVEGGKKTYIGGATGTLGMVFSYGKKLDPHTWKSIEGKLARKELPPPSQLFFCDALLDVAEEDIAQAVVALGASCEIEMQNLVREIAKARGGDAQALIGRGRLVRKQFRDTFEIVEVLGGQPFPAVETVVKLYEERGKAIHRGQLEHVSVSNITDFVNAVEALFSWAKAQRKFFLTPRTYK
jgi:hypothetical protein